MKQKCRFLAFPPGQDYHHHLNVWIREIFSLPYIVFFLVTLLDKMFPGHNLIHYMSRLAFAVHAPAMLFAAGCLLGMMDWKSTEFKKNILLMALYCSLAFFFIGYITEVFVKDRDAYTTAKDLLVIVRVPDISSIFLTLFFLFLICAFLGKYIEFCLEHRFLLTLLLLTGLLAFFIPEGLLGYGLTGVLSGGVELNTIPLAYYLPAFISGILFTANPSGSLLQKKALITLGVLAAYSGLFIIIRQKHPVVVIGGILAAYCCLIVSTVIFPLYIHAEELTRRIIRDIRCLILSVQEESKNNRLVNIIVYYGAFCLLFAFTAYYVFYPYIREGRLLLWAVDGLGQYVPRTYRFIVHIPTVIRSLLHGNINYRQYDFSSGLGSAITFSHEPIYWLNLLFKPSQAGEAYSVLAFLRFFFSGISISVMLRYFKKPAFPSLLTSIVYAFSGYAVYTGTRHGQFLVPLILIPVLIVAMEELISKKKWAPLTIFTAISLLCSYYFMYMNTIALGIYFIIRILCTREYRNLKTFFGRGLLIVGCYILGCAMGCITLFNSFGGYVGSSRSEGESVSRFLTISPFYYRSQWIPDFFVSFISDSYAPGLWLKIGLAPLAFLALILLFTRTKKKEAKVIFLLLTLFCVIPLIGYIFNGFSNVSNRWCYIYVAAVSFILAEYLDDFQDLSMVELGLMSGITIFYGLIIFFSTKYRTDKVFAAFGLLAMTLIIVILLNNGKITIKRQAGQAILLGITLFTIIINANLYIANESGETPHMESYVKAGDAIAAISNTALKHLNEIPEAKTDSGFYRSTNLSTYGNNRSSSMVLGYNDISCFNSTLNGGIVNYNTQMGNVDYNIVSIYSYNFRTIMHELACVRYIGKDENMLFPLPYGYQEVLNKTDGKHTYNIYENQYTLPLGYTYSSVTTDKDISSYSAAQKQEVTLESAVIEKEKESELKELRSVHKPATTVHKLPLLNTELTNVTIKDGLISIGAEGGSITFYFQGENNAETYLSFDGDIVFPADGAEHFIKSVISTDGLKYSHKFRVDAYSTGQPEYLFNLGYHENAISSCTMSFPEGGQLTYDEICIYSQPMDHYAQKVSALKNESMENVTVSTNTVTGRINVTDNKLLVIALPYQSGWTAYVDGKKSSLFRANYQYMGIKLGPGNHDIRLEYHMPGLKTAYICTISGMIVFLLLLFLQFLKRRRDNNKEKA